MSTEKLQEKIESLKGYLAEERELRKAAQRELNETRKLLGKAQSLAAKMGKACADLNEAVNEGEDAAPKKGGDKKVKAGKTDKKVADKPSKKDKGDKLSKKDKGDKSEVKKGKSDKKGKGKSSKVVDLDDTYED